MAALTVTPIPYTLNRALSDETGIGSRRTLKVCISWMVRNTSVREGLALSFPLRSCRHLMSAWTVNAGTFLLVCGVIAMILILIRHILLTHSVMFMSGCQEAASEWT